MESLRKFGLLDADGKPLDERLIKVAQRSPATVPETASRNPGRSGDHRSLRGGGATHRETRTSSPDQSRSLGGYAWKALESIGVSYHRRSSMQVRFNSVESRTGPEIVSQSASVGWLGRADRAGHPVARDRGDTDAGGGADLPPEGPRLLERGDREAPRQLGELGRQGDEPLEAENSRADGPKE